MKESQLPEKEFLFGVLATLNPDALRELVAQCMKNRSSNKQDDNSEMIEVSGELKSAIENMYSMNSKVLFCLILTLWLATKGRANYLLKKSSVLNSDRKPPRKFQADFSEFQSYKHEAASNNFQAENEEKKEEDDM